MTDLTSHADTLDHLERAINERDQWRLLARAALDQLALVATAPERYETLQRDLKQERIAFVAESLREDTVGLR